MVGKTALKAYVIFQRFPLKTTQDLISDHFSSSLSITFISFAFVTEIYFYLYLHFQFVLFDFPPLINRFHA